ncbi:hypothetical protein B0H11DRAFT_2213199 [Mycena galericulata]|nr:hypothetical protein B0H11DRAFT_2213199 [Mycena galericulata]
MIGPQLFSLSAPLLLLGHREDTHRMRNFRHLEQLPHIETAILPTGRIPIRIVPNPIHSILARPVQTVITTLEMSSYTLGIVPTLGSHPIKLGLTDEL